MIPCYTTEPMRRAEQTAERVYGIPLSRLMDNAGVRLAHEVAAMLGNGRGRVSVICGKGNNGGDGYVCAARLLKLGAAVSVWGVGRAYLPAESLVFNAAADFEAAGGVIRTFSPDLAPGDLAADLIVDALFGTGLTRPLSGVYARAVALINASGPPVLSCDVPSGVNADTGEILGAAVRARRTLMLGLAKKACRIPPGSVCFGELALGDIGLPPELIAQL